MVSVQVFMGPSFVVDLGYAIGFDMSVMKEEVYGEAIVDVVKPGTLVSEPVIIKVRRNQQMYGHSLTYPFSACRTYTSQMYNPVSSTSSHHSPSCAPRPNARKSTRLCCTSTPFSLRWECRFRRRQKSKWQTRARLSLRRCGRLEGNSNRKDARVKEGTRPPVRRR